MKLHSVDTNRLKKKLNSSTYHSFDSTVCSIQLHYKCSILALLPIFQNLCTRWIQHVITGGNMAPISPSTKVTLKSVSNDGSLGRYLLLIPCLLFWLPCFTFSEREHEKRFISCFDDVYDFSVHLLYSLGRQLHLSTSAPQSACQIKWWRKILSHTENMTAADCRESHVPFIFASS